MKIYALLAWFNERPDHLRRAVTSLRGFADVLVAVDGPYATFEHTRAESPTVQHGALTDAARAAGLMPYLVTPAFAWKSEVAKRAAMFEYARRAGATSEDWFLVIDADEALGDITPDTRAWLEDTNRDVAEIRYERVQIDGVVCGVTRDRRLYRALPGLTVERAHYLYTVPCRKFEHKGTNRPHFECQGTGRRFLWHRPDGHMSDEPTLDLFGHVTFQHFNSSRDPDRRQRALDYYKQRDAAGLEHVGDWR